jgi:UDP-N-acetylmuramyl-tripeptide synthetase
MTIAELIKGLPIDLRAGPAATRIESIVEDSRRAGPGCLFAARPGSRADGADHAGEAVARGAAAVLVEGDPCALPPGAAVLATARVADMLGPLAERFHGDPTRALRLVGVTGTNGKTTIAHLVQQVLGRGGVRCGLIGTVQIDDGAARYTAHMTTPPAVETSRLLARMRDNGCGAAAMEVSSHALDQGRCAGLRFTAAVFTNLSGDHLDYHGTMEAYGAAKQRLFRGLAPEASAILNADDPAAALMAAGCAARIVTCSVEDRSASCFAEIHGGSIAGMDATFHGSWGRFRIHLPLAGRHNAINALQAAAAAFAAGAPADSLGEALAACAPPPGRLERVTAAGDAITVLVDYAHTDAALASVLRTLRPLVPAPGRLRVVFGCGGDRDRTKRPRMGRVAAELGDDLIVTSDNPRTEPPEAIIAEILAGVPEGRRRATATITCREQAIGEAIAGARAGDVVLIAGKGHETCQVIGTASRPFDDRAVAAAALRDRRGREAVVA